MTNMFTNWVYEISGLFKLISFRRPLNSLCENLSPQLHNKCLRVSIEIFWSLTSGDTLNALNISSGIFSIWLCAWAQSRKSANLIDSSSDYCCDYDMSKVHHLLYNNSKRFFVI